MRRWAFDSEFAATRRFSLSRANPPARGTSNRVLCAPRPNSAWRFPSTMRKTSLLTLILLVCASWVVAQQGTVPPTPPSGPQTTPGPPSPGANPNSQTGPGGGQAMQPPAAENSIEGCLGGSAGSLTLTDSAGTTYQLQLPEGANSSALSRHVGEEIRVSGTMTAPGRAAGSAPGGQPTINVAQMYKIGNTCGTNSQSPTSK